MSSGPESPQSLHEIVGGDRFFTDLVDRFYDGIETDAVLAPMYPTDTSEARRHLAGLLSQYWGGPPTYSEERGHPRLRMRHMPFRIDSVAAEAWLSRMGSALDQMDVAQEARAPIWEHFERSAEFLHNAE